MRKNDEIIKVFAKINNVKTMKRFFNEIFTENERKDFTLRWQLMKMLNAKMAQREIASKLGVSLCKITRGAKILKSRNSAAKRILNKKLNRKKRK